MANQTDKYEKENFADVEIYNNEVDTILNDPPVWMVRVGSYMIYGLVLIIIAIAAIVKYPDTITTEIVINSADTANIKIPYSNAAKQINLNTSVSIELNNYPAKDFGVLYAKIKQFEYYANTQEYLLTVLLPKNFKSNTGKTIKHVENNKGKATIVLNNKSLLQRVFEALLK
ncbi:MAG: hypothetical protein LBS69_06225 [Prevotellaceae bacterium]|jgi:hypothetical protein|nr:hypothetical protein [Prevotellaceae bacterium]